ncbi:MAG: hypothetical protein CFE24_07325 [Flavobacterium sp. BFFFF2]|nr:MAG: hypothetical protein CFE24_07325 [Flavobacterium sp. BFFFF2]
MKKRHQQKLIILSFALWVLFNFPLVLLFNSSDQVGGYPILSVYLFSVVCLSVLISWLVITIYHE